MPTELTQDNVTIAQMHDFWQQRIYNARQRLRRQTKEAQWAIWAKSADLVDIKQLNFAEAVRRDVKLDVIGERPLITVRAKRAADAPYEFAFTKLIELEMDDADNWDAIERVVEDASLSGTGWLRADWASGDGDEPSLTEEEESEQVALAKQHIADLLSGNTVTVGRDEAHALHIELESSALSEFGLTTEQQNALAAHIMEHSKLMPQISSGRFRLSRIHPSNILFDDTADEWRYCEWVAERSVQLLEDVQNNPQFSNTKNLQGKSEIRRRGYRKNRSRLTKAPQYSFVSQYGVMNTEAKYEVLWYIHDIRNSRLIVIAEDHPDHKPLYVGDWPYRSTIYFPLVFDRESDGIEGISDYARIFYPCMLRAEIQERWIEHLALHSKRKILHTDEFLDEKGRAQLTDPNSALVRVNNLNGFATLPDIQINADAYRVDNVMQENINRMLGVSEQHQGVLGASASATEASIADAARGRVVRHRRRRVATMLKWVAKKVLEYYSSFATDTLLIKRGVSPERDIVLDPENITDEVFITVDVDTLSPANAELNRQLIRQAIEVITASPWLMEGLGTKGRQELLKLYLRSQRLLSDPEEILEEAAQELIQQGRLEPVAARAARKVTGAAGAVPGGPQANLMAGPQNISPGQGYGPGTQG